MEYEIATEAFQDTAAIPNCTKNPDHVGFIKYDDFKLEDLPEDMRREEVYQYIKNIGLRVVRLTVKKEDGSQVYGTGVVYKAGKLYLIGTNDHVVATQNEAEDCIIDFFYHNDEDNGIVKCRGVALLGCSEIQDKSVFTFSPIPKFVKKMNLKDNSDNLVSVSLKYGDGFKRKNIGCIFKELSRWHVLVSRQIREQPIIACKMKFWNVKTGKRYQYRTDSNSIDVTDKKLIKIEIPGDKVPQYVKDSTTDKFDAPWPRGNRNFTPLVIAHPHGGPKAITMGKLLDFEHHGHIALIRHTAETCPGSSGGLLITLGGDTSSYCEYCNTVGVHCQGQQVEEYKGIKIDNGNLNIALFNNS